MNLARRKTCDTRRRGGSIPRRCSLPACCLSQLKVNAFKCTLENNHLYSPNILALTGGPSDPSCLQEAHAQPPPPLATPTHLNPSSPSASTTSSMAEPHTPPLLLGTDTRPPTPPPRITQPSTTVTKMPQASPLPLPHQPPPSKALQGGPPPPPLQHRH